MEKKIVWVGNNTYDCIKEQINEHGEVTIESAYCDSITLINVDSEVESLQAEIKRLENEVDYWINQHDDLQEKHDELETQFEEYKENEPVGIKDLNHFILKLKNDGLYNDQLDIFIEEYMKWYNI